MGLTLLCLLVELGAAAAPALAEAPGDPVENLVTEAQARGSRVIILEPDTGAGEPAAKPAGTPGVGARAAEITGQAIARLRSSIGEAGGHLAALPAALAALAPDGSPLWPARVAGVAILGLILGHVAFRIVARRLFPRRPAAARETTRAERLRACLGNGLIGFLGVAVEAAAALILPVIVFGGIPETRIVLAAVIELLLIVRLAMVFFAAVIAAHDPCRRPIALNDAAAGRLWSHLRVGLIAMLAVGVPLHLVVAIDAPADLKALVAIAGITTAGLILILVIVANRAALESLVIPPGAAGSLLLRKWWVMAIGYVGGAWFVSSVRWLLGLPHAFGLIGAPIVGAMVAATLYGILLLTIERMRNRAAAQFVGAEDRVVPDAGRHWADRSALVVAIAGAALYVLDAWGVEFRREDGRIGLVAIGALALVLSYVGWAAIRAWFDRRIAEEIGEVGPATGDEGGGAGSSRLATLLPLFRNMILATIVAVAAMILLLEAGVNIAPLFAGAGILGLAIGFGAQTLIRDIFSGLFFLIDDAFRVGEYIETGAAKGTVERISIRSMQLRHQNGPLHTVPFGEIRQLTNYSRDWVIMKLPLRVTLDTDPERVRKLVKMLGQEMLADPVVGPKFVEPLKSQGVLSIDNFGIVIRVKFMTKPGDQFVTRRVVYARLYKLFDREGVQFAGRDVRVRVDPATPGDPRVARAAAALEAAEPSAGEDGPGASRGDDR